MNEHENLETNASQQTQKQEIITNETTPEPPRLKRKKFWSLKKFALSIIIAIIFVILGWMGVYVYFAHTNQFPIKTVKVLGEYQYVSQTDIEAVLAPFVANKGLFTFSELDAEHALEKIPGVASASIWRVPPSKIKVIIRERSATARFMDGRLLSTDGVLFTTTNPSGAANLPLLNGNPHYTKEMLTMLQSLQPIFATINANVTGLGLASNGDWSVQLNNQTWIMLGKNDLQDRVLNFLTAYPVLIKTAQNNASLTYVDLRYSHGFSAAWSTPQNASTS